MKRLKRLADETLENQLGKEQQIEVEVARQAINSLDIEIDGILEQYKSLFEKLSSIETEYPGLHGKLKSMVRFPTEYDTRDVVRMKEDLNKIKEMYSNDQDLLRALGNQAPVELE